jgi:hypothetical protein
MKKIFPAFMLLTVLLACNKEDEVINPPTITSLSPLTGGFGSELIIKGTNFSNSTTENVVTINGVEAEVKSASSTSLKVLVPALVEGSLPVKVTTEAGEADGGMFKYNYDVYVVGYEAKSTGLLVGKYWKNGIAVPLSEGTAYTVPEAIAISENDIYVAGWERSADLETTTAKLWKNGASQDLTTSTYSEAFDIAVNGNDVYVAGGELDGGKMITKYWKNGVATSLTNGDYYSKAYAIAVSDGDVYVAGCESNGTNLVAKYWKNGSQVSLTDGTNYAEATDIAVVGSTVYVLGYENNGTNKTIIKYWKNGVATSLTEGTAFAYSNAIAIEGSDIYVAGSEDIDPSASTMFDARYWKNGSMVSLTPVTHYAEAKSICVVGQDVFVSGVYFGGSVDAAIYWKNGNEVLLTDGTYSGIANDIVVR